jgi:hypothetical protein
MMHFFLLFCVCGVNVSQKRQINRLSQLNFFRHIMFKLCCMFWLFYKAIIRHKHKKITLYKKTIANYGLRSHACGYSYRLVIYILAKAGL